MRYKLIIILLFTSFSVLGYGEEYPQTPNGINKFSDLCAKNGELFGHTVVVIDLTSKLERAQVNYIKKMVFTEKFFTSYKPFTKFSYLLIDRNKKPASQEYILSKCRPKSGKKTVYGDSEMHTYDENARFIKRYWSRFLSNIKTAEKKIFDINSSIKPADKSFIYETIATVSNLTDFDFQNDYPKDSRELVIVSDMMQHTDRVSFYEKCRAHDDYKKHPLFSTCPTYSALLSADSTMKDYIEKTTPKGLGVNVKIIYLNHNYETKRELDKGLLKLWEDYFESSGFKRPIVNRQLDIY